MSPRRVKVASPQGQSDEPSSPDPLDFGLGNLSPGPSRRRRRRKPDAWIGRSLAVVATSAAALYAFAAVALHMFVDTDVVRAWVAPRVASALNRSVEIQGADVTLFPRPSVRLTDISIDNLSGFDGPSFARLEEAQLDVAWLPLLIGRVSVHRVRLDGATIHLAIDENGVSNFGDLVPESNASAIEGAGPIIADVDRITVTNASLSYFDAPKSRSFAISGGHAETELTRDEEGWRAAVTLESDSLHARVAAISPDILRVAGPTATIAARGDLDLSGIDVEGGFVELGGDTLDVRGNIAGLSESRTHYDFELTNSDLNARVLATWFPTEVRQRWLPGAEGALGVSMRVQGGLTAADRPTMRGVVRLDDVAVRLRGEVVAEHLEGFIGIDSARISFDSVNGNLMGGPFDLAGVIARDERGSSSFALRAQPRLDALDRLELLPEGTALSGSATLDVSLTGPARALDSIEIVGGASLDGFQLELARFGAPLYVPAGVVTLTGRGVTWTDLPVIVGTDPTTTSGTLDEVAALWSDGPSRPHLDAQLAGARMDLGVLLPPSPDDDRATYAQVAFAHLGARGMGGLSAAEVADAGGIARPLRFPVLGSVVLRFDSLSHGRYRLEAVQAKVDLTDSALYVTDASFGAWGGRSRASLQVGVGEVSHQPFALRLSVDSAAAQPFLAELTPLGEAISGTLGLELEVTGFTDDRLLPVIDSLSGRGRVTVADGALVGTGVNAALADFLEADAWATIPFTRWVTDVAIRDRVLEVSDGELTGTMARVVFHGLLDFGGSADLSMALSVPSTLLDAVSLRRTGIGPSVVQQLKAAGQPLDLGLHLSGTLEAPTLEPDATNALGLAGL